MNETDKLFGGPIITESWYEDHEKCECDPPFDQTPTEDFLSHQKSCPLREILYNKEINRWII